MRKYVLLGFLCLIVVLLLGSSKMVNRGIPLKYFPENSILRRTLNFPQDHVLNEIVLLPETEFSEKDAASIIASLSKIPYNQLEALKNEKVYIKLFTGKLTDHPSAGHLKGVVPKGYKSGKTWDDVPGMGGGKMVLVKIGHSERGKGHGSVNLELHEIAHSIDRHVYGGLRNSREFLRLWREEKARLFPRNTYFWKYPEEYFAETFAMFYYNRTSRTTLKMYAPKTYQYIKDLP